MMLTEAEAAQKWCPQTTRPPMFAPDITSCCIGAYCMWWRWEAGNPLNTTGLRGFCGAAYSVRLP